MMAKFYHFHQNNSGGGFDVDDEKGIGPEIWIEAKDADEANRRGEAAGMYWDGCEDGQDCPCCGDRWYPAEEYDAKDAPKIDPEYHFNWHETVYVHYLDGRIERIVGKSRYK